MKETWRNLKRVYSYGKEFKKYLIFEIIGSLIGVVIGVVLPIFIAKQLVHFTNGVWEEVIYITLILLGINVISRINHFFIRKSCQILRRGIIKNVQVVAGKEMLKIEQNDIDSHSSGLFIQRLVNDTYTMPAIFTVGMGYLEGVIANIGVFVAIFIINKTIFLYYLLVSIILTILHLIKVRKYNEKDKTYRNQSEKVAGLTGELVRGSRDIKMLNAKNSFMVELEQNIDKQNQDCFNMRNVDMNYNLVIEVLTGVFEFILVLLLILLIKNNQITIAIGIVLFTYRDKVMIDLMDKIGKLLTEIKSFNLSCNRVFSIIKSKDFKKEQFGKKHLEEVKGNLSFKNVNFEYVEGNLVLKDLSFEIKAKETIGFVGKSGAGKTTIFSLLCKLYNANSGSILIENEDINELDEDSIRGNITIINQNPYIFNMSIKDNLKLVKEDLTDKEIEEACRVACLDSFIENLPQKYDTVVGEGGVTLSGGQKQRLAIARAFVQKTKIILFDEATSALDNETQHMIQQAINNLKNEYTILIIAHRLTTIVNCDKIMLLDNGKLNAIGTHKELLKTNKIYKKLYENELIEND